MKKLVVIILFGCLALNSFSKEIRDVLQKEAKEIGLSQALIKNFSEIGFPTKSNISKRLKNQSVTTGRW